MKENKFDNEIMKLLRIERNLDENDTSEDEEINSYSVNEAYKSLLMFGSYDNFDVQIRKEFLEELNKKMTK
jgi:hypothetical protein